MNASFKLLFMVDYPLSLPSTST